MKINIEKIQIWTPFAPHFFIICPILLKFRHNMLNRKKKKTLFVIENVSI